MDSKKIKNLQMQEAVERLKILQQVYKVHPNILNEFKQDGTVYYSERINKSYDGVLYWLNNRPEFEEAVKEIEEKHNIYIYHAILNHTEYGPWLSMLYISDTPDNWEDEKSELKSGMPYAYVYDFTGYGSEFGLIKIAGANGGLTRVT